MNKRLESLDVLRGFDLICLIVLEPFAHKVGRVDGSMWREWTFVLFNHTPWEGFSTWDLVMPLFMFISGITIPYSYGRYRGDDNFLPVFYRLSRRFILLWVLGVVCQVKILALDVHHFSLFSNALQAIAVGYVISTVIFLRTRWKTQIAIAFALLLSYWVVMEFCSVGSYGNGNYSEHGNFAEGIDMLILGQYRNTAQVVGGDVYIDPTYTYTWILSSLNFVVTVLAGVLVGQILKSELSQKKKLRVINLSGLLMFFIGWMMGFIHPIIKNIWTSSMVMLSSGLCFLLMGIFYYIIDCCGYNKNLTLFKIYGMNSILAYVLSMKVDFSFVINLLPYGIEKKSGEYYPFVVLFGNFLFVFLILFFYIEERCLLEYN